MSSSQHCIVIMYNGKDIPEHKQDGIMAELITTLANHGVCIPELATVVYKDSEGIAASIARDVLGAKEQIVQPVTEDPVKNALIYLKKRYEEELSCSILIPLVLKVSDDIRAHKAMVASGQEGDVLLMNSLEILTTHHIDATMPTLYGISERALNIFEQCYRHC